MSKRLAMGLCLAMASTGVARAEVWACVQPAGLSARESLHAAGVYIVAFDETRRFGCSATHHFPMIGDDGASKPEIVAALRESLASNCASDMNGMPGLPPPEDQKFSSSGGKVQFGAYQRFTLDRTTMGVAVENMRSGVWTPRWRGQCRVTTDFGDPIAAAARARRR